MADNCVQPPQDYLWIVVVGGIASFVMAYGIGANDVANAFATSVGSKTLKLWQAVIIAGIFEFTGSLMGAQVTETIRSGIVSPDKFVDEPAVLMLGNLCALMGAGMWVLIATRLGLPVSTTHSIVGAIIGFAVVAAGWGSVDWAEVGFIALSWVVSPVLTGLMSATVFFLVRRFILRKPDSLRRGFIFYPVLVAITAAVNIFYVLYKGLPNVINEEDLPEWQGVLIALAAGVVIAVLVQLTFVPWLRRHVDRSMWGQSYSTVSADENTSLIKPETVVISSESVPHTTEPVNVTDSTAIDVTGLKYDQLPAAPPPVQAKSFMKEQWSRMIGNELETTAFENPAIKAMHDAAEKFDPKTEHIFSFLQVVTACFMSFAHGANDVANSIGPFASIYSIYVENEIPETTDVEIWILALGGGGIVIGLLTYGYNVIRSIGLEMIKITPSRGFCIEVSSATVVIAASMIGIPVSSTHCQVGSTAAVGLLEGKSGFNVWLFFKTFVSWVFTLIFAATVTAGIFSFAHFAP